MMNIPKLDQQCWVARIQEALSHKYPLKLSFLSRHTKCLIVFSLCVGLIFLSGFFRMKNKDYA